MKKIINLTPHPIVVELEDGTRVSFPPSGSVARVSTAAQVVAVYDGINVLQTFFGEVDGLPEPEEGTVFIVSTLVAQRAKRVDVVAPLTDSSAIRENGQIVAVRGFQTF